MSADAQPNQTSPGTTPTGETLHRHLSFWNSLTLGFAMVSPVVGLYAIMGVQTAVTGDGWFVALAICLVMQLLVATIIAFGTGGLYAMFTITTGVGLYTRLTGQWDPALGHLKLGRWGLPINVIAFHWSLFEFINIAWPRPYAVSPDAPW